MKKYIPRLTCTLKQVSEAIIKGMKFGERWTMVMRLWHEEDLYNVWSIGFG